MKKIIKSLIFVIIALAIIYIFLPGFQDGKCNQFEDFKKISVNGIVVNKFIDVDQHSYPVIYIKNFNTNEIIKLNMILDTSNFFIGTNLKDTLLKKIDDNKIYRKEKGTYRIFKVIDFGCQLKTQ